MNNCSRQFSVKHPTSFLVLLFYYQFINIYESIGDKEQFVEHKFFCIKRNLIK